ncbi:MAG: hypothetical protein RBR68_11860 [Tenuifilaceae bacterium]|nr:hypothetical protein [Tenuifilaceae bacterium]
MSITYYSKYDTCNIGFSNYISEYTDSYIDTKEDILNISPTPNFGFIKRYSNAKFYRSSTATTESGYVVNVNEPRIKDNNIFGKSSILLEGTTYNKAEEILFLDTISVLDSDNLTIQIWLNKNETLNTIEDKTNTLISVGLDYNKTYNTFKNGLTLTRKYNLEELFPYWELKLVGSSQEEIIQLEFQDNLDNEDCLISLTISPSTVSLYYNNDLKTTADNTIDTKILGDRLYIGSLFGTSSFIDTYIHDVIIYKGIKSLSRVSSDYLNSTTVRPYIDTLQSVECSQLICNKDLDILKIKTLNINTNTTQSEETINLEIESNSNSILYAIDGIIGKTIVSPKYIGENSLSITISETKYVSIKREADNYSFIIKFLINELLDRLEIKEVGELIQYMDTTVKEYTTFFLEDLIKLGFRSFIKREYEEL